MPDLQFPIGQPELEDGLTAQGRSNLILQVDACPQELRDAVAGLSDGQLDTPYRPGGWTVRQVVHHLPDSHINVYSRFRLALTEDEPAVRTFDHDGWAELPDARLAPISSSLELLRAVHSRWVLLMEALTDADWKRSFRHPEEGLLDLEFTLQRYAWHGRHHVAHIASLRERMHW